MTPLPELLYRICGVGRPPKQINRHNPGRHSRRDSGRRATHRRDPRPASEYYHSERRHTRVHQYRQQYGQEHHENHHPSRYWHHPHYILELTDLDASLPSNYYDGTIFIKHPSRSDLPGGYEFHKLAGYIHKHGEWPSRIDLGIGHLMWTDARGHLLAIQRVDDFFHACYNYYKRNETHRRAREPYAQGQWPNPGPNLVLKIAQEDHPIPPGYHKGRIFINHASSPDTVELSHLVSHIRKSDFQWPLEFNWGRGYLVWTNSRGHLLAVQRSHDFIRALQKREHRKSRCSNR